MIRYGTAKEILKKYVGTGGQEPRPEELDLFVQEVMQELLHSGAHGNERTFKFHAQNGIFTIPKELETPLKVKVNGVVGSIWNQWFEYHSGIEFDKLDNAFMVLPDGYPTVYDLPDGGAYVGVIGTNCEDADAHVIIKGEDPLGNVVYTYQQGEHVVGEYLSIKKGQRSISNVKFGKITEVYKTETSGYVQLIWISQDNYRGLLSDYEPFEQSPYYRRVKIHGTCPPIASVSVLGRIRLKEKYVDDDLIPFSNIRLLSLMGQSIFSGNNNDLQTASAKESMIATKIENESEYKKINNGQTFEMFYPLSGGSIANPTGRSIRRRRRFR